ncbi:MAG: Rnf-Nqr domain containing protein, partial [Gemmatimonadota bacterium]
MIANLAWIFLSAAVINNFTLALFLGLCPFLGVSGKVSTAVRMGSANVFVLTITSLCVWALNTWVLPHAPYLQL